MVQKHSVCQFVPVKDAAKDFLLLKFYFVRNQTLWCPRLQRQSFGGSLRVLFET